MTTHQHKTPYQPRTSSLSGISLSDSARLDCWLQSKPSEVIRAFKQATIYSLSSIEAVRLLAKTNPYRYELLVAEAVAQGFPIN